MNRKFKQFSDIELYILKRALIESAGEIAFSGIYDDTEIKIHNILLNECIDEGKERRKKCDCGIDS